jgi:predicted nuclease with RNAse H fold
MELAARWMGVDVGGKRKPFDAALIEDQRLVDLRQRQSIDNVVAWVASVKPTVVAIDSPDRAQPRAHAPAGRKRLRETVCGIRWTPPTPSSKPIRTTSGSSRDYASTTRWRANHSRWSSVTDRLLDAPARARSGRQRSVWTREALAALGLKDAPPRTNQDMRDAIAAALTARDYEQGRFETFGGIVVARPA